MRFIKQLLLPIFSLLCLFALYPGQAIGSTLKTDISSAISHGHLNASYGVLIEGYKRRKVLYRYDASKRFIPASNMKLLTAIAALKFLGSNFRFQTVVYINPQQLKGSILHGDLVFHFSGDPTITTADLATLVRRVRQAGIHKVVGNVVIDTSAYSGPDIPIGWLKDDLHYCYGAKATSVIINENCMHMNLLQTHTEKTKLIKYPDSVPFYVSNNVDMVPHHALKKCVFWPNITEKNKVYLRGCLPPKRRYTFAFAVTNPPLFAEHTIEVLLKKNHIVVTGHNIIRKKSPSERHIIARHFSSTLGLIIQSMLQHSNNLYANTITRTLGLYYYRTGSFKAGVNAIKSILSTKGHINLSNASIEDGSGLSRYNLLSPDEFVQVINYALSEPSLANALAKDLPVSGRSGTLYYRMTSKEMAGRVFAKTGSMHDVSTLSGYVYTRHHHKVVFSIMINSFVASLHRARELEDKIVHLTYLYA